MTPREFHNSITPLLDLRTFEPFVLVGTNGGVVHIDHPEELVEGLPFRLNRRRAEGGSTVIDPKDVVAVMRLEEYAGAEGRRFTHFRDTLRSLLRAEPFTPFEIELRSAQKLRVDSPNRLAMSGRFALITGAARPLTTFSDAEVVRIIPGEVPVHAG
jgi:hypothetical protein